MPKPYDVFVSYSRSDAGFVRELIDELKLLGIVVFHDEADIAVGDSLAESLNRAVRDANFFLVVMSPEYFASQWATKELDLALNQEFERSRSNGAIKVIPLLRRDCEIPPLLRAKVYLDVRTEEAFRQSLPRLVAVLAGRSAPPTRVSGVLKPEGPPPGSISRSVIESAELREMITQLRTKVEAFIEGSETSPRLPTAARPTADPTLCFVVMPFGLEGLNDVYEFFVKPSIEANCGLRCERGDDVFGSNVIMDDIRQSIERSRLVLADLTGRNPNVFYEVGIAHTLNKDVLLLSQSMSDVPFDLRHRRVLVYEYTPKGCKRLEKSVAVNVNAILKQGVQRGA